MRPTEKWLSQGVHTAIVGSDLVVLSLRANAYYCLAGAAQWLSWPAPGRIAFSDEALCATLEAAGLISNAPPDEAPSEPARLQPPTWDLLDHPVRVKARDRMDMALALGVMAQRYCGNSLWSMVKSARAMARAAQASEAAVSEGVIARACAFQQMLPWIPLQGQCLYRAFMLLNFLRLGGHRARWVFGVRTWPFQAHCWLQAGELALDDAAERVGAYTPILVV